jgi:predicted transcriptional regulator
MKTEEKLKRVMNLIERLGLTKTDVHEHIANNSDIFCQEVISKKTVFEMLLEDILIHTADDGHYKLLIKIKEDNERGGQLSREIFKTLRDEDTVEIMDQTMMVDFVMGDWVNEYFEYDYEEVMNTLTRISRDQKLTTIGIE